MSNYLAIATVTAALKNILQTGIKNDLPGTQVTTVRPDTLASGVKERKINIFLYHAAPSDALRNMDLRPRRPQSGLTQSKVLALDLHYLFTFLGNETELEPQQLLGCVVRTLVDRAALTPEIIRETIFRSPFLAESNLAEQLQEVRFYPTMMKAEELSRLWSVMFQSPYSLSLSYLVKAVLIEGEKKGQSALPVRSVATHVAPARPLIERIESDSKPRGTITAKSNLIIYGQKLQGNNTQIKIGEAKITPQNIQNNTVRLDLSALFLAESKELRAGVQSLQIIQSPSKNNTNNYIRTIESNIVPFVLCPNIVGKVTVTDRNEDWQQLYSANINIQVDLKVTKRQRVYLLLNETSNKNPESYVFPAKRRGNNTNLIVFPANGVKAGTYLVRVQIDGAESPLRIDTNPNSMTVGQYCEPKIIIGENDDDDLEGDFLDTKAVRVDSSKERSQFFLPPL